MKKWFLFLTLVCSVSVQAAVKTEVVNYKDGKTDLEGFIAYDDSVKTSRPVVMIVHQWMGLGENEKMRAKMLAEKGYVAFAVDIYGKGVRPTGYPEAGKLAGEYKENRKLFRQREQAAYDFIKKDKRVDSKKIVIIGYCFGGTGALELARTGAALAGVVSFHGGLSNPQPQDAKKIKAPVMVFHGAVDPNVPLAEVESFKREMNDAQVDYQFISYSNAVHAFTQKEAGNDNSKGAAYNELADRRSWRELGIFLDDVAPLK